MSRIAQFVCVASLALAGTAGAAHHEAAEAAPAMAWDQAQVTTLAGELSKAVKGIRSSVRQSGPRSVGSMQSRKFHQFTDKLRLIESESRHLASELAEGQDLEATLPAYRRLQLLVRDARELSQRLFIEKPIQDRIDVGRAKLDALAAYYPPTE